MMPLCLYKVSRWKTLKQSAIFQKKSRSSAAATDEFRGIEVSIPAPCRGRGSAPEAISIDTSTAISIDFTAISTNVAVSYDEEGVVLPRG
jgi:hypothetical protein